MALNAIKKVNFCLNFFIQKYEPFLLRLFEMDPRQPHFYY